MNIENKEITLLIKAQAGDKEAMNELISMFYPLIRKNSYINNKLDQDCIQELTIKLIQAIQNFKCIEEKTAA